jgi:hypothetical protein
MRRIQFSLKTKGIVLGKITETEDGDFLPVVTQLVQK